MTARQEKSVSDMQAEYLKRELNFKRKDRSKNPEAYQKALVAYTDYLAQTKGAVAAEHVMYWEGTRRHWDKWGKKALVGALAVGAFFAVTGIVLTPEMLAAGGELAMNFIVNNWMRIAVSAVVGYGFSKLVPWLQELAMNTGENKIKLQNAVRAAVEAQKNGVSYVDFRETPEGKTIRNYVNWKKRSVGAGRMAGTALAIGGSIEFGMSPVQELLNYAGLGNASTEIPAWISNLIVENDVYNSEVARANLSASAHKFAFVAGVAGTRLHDALAPGAEAAETAKEIPKLGVDPYIPGETLAERAAYFAANYDKLIARAADELAREGNWSPERKAAFLQALKENREAILDRFSGKVPNDGTIKSGSRIPVMMNGENPSGGVNEARGPYKYTGADTPAVLFEYSADGKTYLAGIPTDCGNFSDLGPVEPTPVEVPPEKKACGPTAEYTEVTQKDGSKIAIIERRGVSPAQTERTDLNKDGNIDNVRTERNGLNGRTAYWEYDSGEVAPELTPEQIAKDIKAIQDAGFKGKILVYTFVDCNGRSSVVCVDIEKFNPNKPLTLGVVYDEHNKNTPITNEAQLDEYFKKYGRSTRILEVKQ
ncbi:MAG: hypothetical protein RLZZ283_102 [Candidatus Parcubacteria bacterium]